jgi:hypothetical protein
MCKAGERNEARSVSLKVSFRSFIATNYLNQLFSVLMRVQLMQLDYH